MDNESYDSIKKKEYTLKLRELLEELPDCCSSFFRSIEGTTSPRTRYGYAVDLKSFFSYLIEHESSFAGRTLKSIDESVLESIQPIHIEKFLEYVSLYTDDDEHERTNNERAKARKLSSIRALMKYLFKREKISRNTAALVDTPKLHQKPIVRLEADEVANMLDIVESGEGLSEKQQAYHKQLNKRDTAIVTLFLGTGIRISELVGIDISDLNFMTNEFAVTRKGGNREILSFGDETRKALLQYLLEREKITPLSGHENALFLSIQKRRITDRAVENLVKKYALTATPLKKITPHKLRSTFGTMLYRETGDIYLVADVLGHKDVNTTKKHYAAQSEDARRMAARVIKLREEGEDTEKKPED